MTVPAHPDRFPACLAVLYPVEGGYSNRSLKADPGGATYKGVTHKTYDAWRRSKGLPLRDVRKMEPLEADTIYREWYWDAVHADALPPGLDLCAFDFSVNSGAGTAIKYLQRAIGVPADSHLGPVTLDRLARLDQAERKQVIRDYVNQRRAFGRNLRNYSANPGWETRWNLIERKALVMAGESPAILTQTPPPLPDPNAQAEATGKAIAEDPKPPVGTEATLSVAGLMSNIGGVSNAFAKIGQGTHPLWAFLSEPLFLTSVVMIAGAAFTFLWRRAHA